MRLEMFLIIGILVNTMMAVLYPSQIFGSDPLGLGEIQQDKLKQYYTANGSSALNNYDATTGQVTMNNDLFNSMSSGVIATEGDAGIFGTDTFTFIDWVKVGWGLLKSTLMFVVGFLFMLWSLVYPLNLLVGVPFSLLYIFAMVRFIMGR